MKQKNTRKKEGKKGDESKEKNEQTSESETLGVVCQRRRLSRSRKRHKFTFRLQRPHTSRETVEYIKGI